MPPYLYVSTLGTDHAMVIVDACPTCGPAFVGVIQGPNFTRPAGISVFGDYAYIPDELTDRLTIVDVSDPTNPTWVSAIAGAGVPNYLDGAIFAHVRNNNLCYVVSRGADNALSIFDVSNPATPTFVGGIRGAGAPPGGNYLNLPATVFVDENLRAYVAATWDNSLTIIDVSNPAAPALLGNIAGPGAPNFLLTVRKVWVRGIYAYTVSDDFHLSIFNVTDPTAPTLVGTVTHASLNGSWSFDIFGSHAYIANTGGGLAVFDISNPAAPFFVSQLVDLRFQSPQGVVVPQDAGTPYQRAYILGSNPAADSCCRLDVSNPAAPAYDSWLQGSGPPNYMMTPIYITKNQTFPPIVRTDPATEIT